MKKISKIRSRISSSTRVITRNHWAFLAISAIGTTCLAALISLLPPVHKILTSVVHEGTVQGPAYILGNILLGYFLLLLGGSLFYIWRDYRQHLRPLKQEMPSIVYSPVPYVKVVFLPRAKHDWRHAMASLSKLAGGSLVLLAAFVFSFTFFVKAAPYDGSGTADDPFQITNCEQLQGINDNLDAHYVLAGNVDCSATASWNSGAGFIPIGISNGGFVGVLDGANFEVQNLYINYSVDVNAVNGNTTQGGGLFSIVFAGGVVKHINLRGGSITTTAAYAHTEPYIWSGALAGFNAGTITASSSDIDVTGGTNIGGLVGVNYGTISRSWSSGDVTGNGSYTELLGGLVSRSFAGGNDGGIFDSYATGNVTGSNIAYPDSSQNFRYCGGLIGEAEDNVERTYSTGSVSCHSNTYSTAAGGLIGLGGDGNLYNFAAGYIDVSGKTGPALSGTGGLLASGWGDLSSNYFDVYGTGQNNCTGPGSGIPCNGVNIGNTQPDYFKGNSTNGPYPHWDFDTVWKTENNSYPMLRIPPDVSTLSAQNTTKTETTLRGRVIHTGDSGVIVRGIRYGLNDSYGSDLNAELQVGENQLDPFQFDIDSLTCGTTYHYQAYATSEDGTGYGRDETFQTENCSGNGGGQTDFSLTKHLNTPAPIVSGDSVSYQLSISNEGPNNSFLAGVIYDIIPLNFSFTSDDSSQMTCTDMGPVSNLGPSLAHIAAIYPGQHMIACGVQGGPYPLDQNQSVEFNILGTATSDYTDGSTTNRAVYFDYTNETSFMSQIQDALANSVDIFSLPSNNVSEDVYVAAVNQSPFILRVKTDNPGGSNDNEFTIPLDRDNFSYSFDLDCDSDGTPEYQNYTDADGDNSITCVYDSPGEYDISISGTLPHMGRGAEGDCPLFSTYNDPKKILDVKQWGSIRWQSMENMFFCASNMNISASDAPDLSDVTEMDGMFMGASALNANINHWDVGHVESMIMLFSEATSFNQPLNNWDVSSVLDMAGMFFRASAFNQNLNDWDVSNVIRMNTLFGHATSFNQPLNNWDVSNVITMEGMFANTPFNQPLNSWDVGGVENMMGMFTFATSFNQPLNNWDVSNVENMSGMFSSASSFDRSLADWQVANVGNMSTMFSDVVSFIISGWESGEGPYEEWDQETKDLLFAMASEILGREINESNYTSFSAGLSTHNYDATLIGWFEQDLQEDVVFDAGTSKYCTSEEERQSIINTFGWTINDSGKDCSPPGPVTYHITDCAEFQAMSISINPITFEEVDPSGDFVIDNDIDCSESANWTWDFLIPGNTVPIGFLSTLDPGDLKFTGTLDGQGYTVSNIYQNSHDTNLSASIFEMTDGAMIKNLTIDNSTIVGPRSGGSSPLAFVAADSIIDNVHVTNLNMTVNSANGQVAGLVGQASYGTQVTNSSAQGAITGSRYSTLGKFYNPQDIAISTSGDHMYIADSSNSRIQDLYGPSSPSEGSAHRAWGEEGSGQGYFNAPTAVVLDNLGFVYINDSTNSRIQKFDEDGNYITQYDFSGRDIAIDSQRNIYVLQQNSIRKYDNDGGFITEFGSFDRSGRLTIFNDEVFVTDVGDGQVEKFSSSGTLLLTFGSIGSGPGQLSNGSEFGDIAIDGDGNIYVVDTSNNRVEKFSEDGDFISQWGASGDGDGEFDYPAGITIPANSSTVYVVDRNNHRIQKFSANGSYLDQFGKSESVFSYPGSYTPSAVSATWYGGLIGQLDGADARLYKSFADIDAEFDIDAPYEPNMYGIVGGGLLAVAGQVQGVSDSYSTGSLSITGSADQMSAVGGLIGQLYSTTVGNSYSSTDVTFENNDSVTFVGGLIGAEAYTPQTSHVNTFAAGSVTGPDNPVFESGASIGVLIHLGGDEQNSSIINNYYDQTTTGQSICIGASLNESMQDIDLPEGTTCSPVNQANQQPNYFKNNNTNPPLNQWDFSSIWKTTCQYPNFIGQSCGDDDGSGNPGNPTTPTTPTTPTRPTPTRPRPTPSTPTSNHTPTAANPSAGAPIEGLVPIAGTDKLPSGAVKSASWWRRISDGSLNVLAWLLIMLLLSMGGVYGYQAYREYAQQKAAIELSQRLQAIKESVTNYANTAIHYLNTPLAIMRSSVELAASLKQVPQSTLDLMQSKLGHFAQTTQELGSAVEGDANDLTQVGSVSPLAHTTTWSRLALWGPIGAAVICFGLVQALLLTHSTDRAWVMNGLQIACFAAGIGLVFFNKHLKVARANLKAQAQQNAATQTASLEQRRTFLQLAARRISTDHEDLSLASQHLPASPSLQTFQNGLGMLGAITQSLHKVTNATNSGQDAPLIDINSLLGRMDSRVQAFAQKQGVQLSSNVPAGLIVQVQPEDADQLFGSVLHNAIKFSKTGGKVQVSGRTTRNKVVIQIRDNGIGIDQTHLEHIFEPFGRATSSTQFDYDGLGLNMYTNKLIADKLGGDLSVQSSSLGTTVTIKLPIPHRSTNSTPVMVTPNQPASGAAVIGTI